MTFVPSIYGLLISLSILACILVAEKRAKTDGKESSKVWDIASTAIISGLAGARAYHVVNYWEFYSQQPEKILHFWEGGLGIWGGIVGALVGVVFYLKLKKEPYVYWLDLIASVAPLGQAIGRWGNFFNQENFGYPTSLPWGIYINPENRPPEFASYEKYHPLFFYESVLDLVLFFVLTKLSKKFKFGSGLILAFYLLGYSIIRFFLEFFRINPWHVYNLDTAQGMCVLAAVAALVYISKTLRKAL